MGIRWFVLAVILCALVGVALLGCAGEVPWAIRDEMANTARAKPGAATVVVFSDFQCPHCRRTHAALREIVGARHDRVRVVMRHVPLPRHPDAETAARSAVCVETALRGRDDAGYENYVRELFEASELSDASCEALAAERGVDRAWFRACLDAPSTTRRLAEDLALFDLLRGDGVPLLYVGSVRVDGAPRQRHLEELVDAAISAR